MKAGVYKWEAGMDRGSKVSRARSAAVEVLTEFNQNNRPVNLLLRDFAGTVQMSSRDLALMNELVYGTLRWQIRSDWLLAQFVHGELADYPATIQQILRCAVYQIMHLDSVPDYAVVNEAVALSRYFREIKFARLVNGVLRNFLRNRRLIKYPEQKENHAEYLSIKYAYPMWMVELILSQYGLTRTEKILFEQNRRPWLTVRVNTFKSEIDSYKERLSAARISYSQGQYFSEFLNLTQYQGRVQDLPGYYEGLFSVQDESAGMVARVSDPLRHSFIADVCSAPGGKSTHLAEICQDRKAIVSIDLSEGRLRVIGRNMDRLGLESVKLLRADGFNLPLRNVDLILVDAPCSGLGVIRKNPDIKIRRAPQDVEAIKKTQWKLLNEACNTLDPGGVLIYSTCTINREENEDLIRGLLQTHSDLSMESLSPYVSGSSVDEEGWINTVNELSRLDGSFCVRLRKGNSYGS